MPGSNTTGGKHHKRGKKNKGNGNVNDDTIKYAGINQVYAVVKKKLGGSRLLLECSDGIERSGIIPGKFTKKIWLNPGDILLCEFDIGDNDSQCYIIHKYFPKDANVLKTQGKITFDITENKEGSSFKFNENNQKSISNNINNNSESFGSSGSSESEELFKQKNLNRNNFINTKNKKGSPVKKIIKNSINKNETMNNKNDIKYIEKTSNSSDDSADVDLNKLI